MAAARESGELTSLIIAAICSIIEIIVYFQFIWMKNALRIIMLVCLIVSIIRFLFLLLTYIIDISNKLYKCNYVFKNIILMFAIVTIIIFIIILIIGGMNTSKDNKFFRECPYTNYPSKIDEEVITEGMKEDKNVYFNKDECKDRRCIFYDYNPNSFYSKLYLCTFDAFKDKVEVTRRYYSGGRSRTSTAYVDPKNVVCTKAINNIGVDDYERYGKKEASFFFRDCVGTTDQLYYCSRSDYPESFNDVKVDHCPGRGRGILSLILYILNICACFFEFFLIVMLYSEFRNVSYPSNDYDFQQNNYEEEEKPIMNNYEYETPKEKYV